MDVVDYMQILKQCVLGKINNLSDMNLVNFNIKSKLVNDHIVYSVSEFNEVGDMTFFIEFSCDSKVAFYDAFNMMIVKTLKENDLVNYSATQIRNDNAIKFSIVSHNNVSVNLDIKDELDEKVCNKFKSYLDQEEIQELESTSNEVKYTKELVVF